MVQTTKTRSLALVAVTVVLLLVGLTGCRADNSILRQRGLVALQQGDKAEAMDIFCLAVERDPTDWRAQYQLGKLLLEQGRPFDAQLALEKARSIRHNHPETSWIIDQLAEAIYQQERYDLLHALLADAAKESGGSGDFLRQGDYLLRMNQIDDARLAYLKAAKFAEPGDAKPCVKLAEFYEHVGDGIKAVSAWKRAYSIEPQNSLICDKLRQHGIVPGPTLASPPRR